jgi:tetratricopeptide (TPR) repeat protein
MRNWAITIVLLLAIGLSAWGQKGADAEQCSPQIDPDVALPHCTAAINSGRLSTSSLALTYMGRGVNYIRKGDYDRAIQDFDEVIRLNPKSSGAFTNRGVSYLQKGDYERAIQDFDKAIQLNPKNKVVFGARGSLFYYRQGDYERDSGL